MKITNTTKFILLLASFMMAINIILGAFGAHAVKDILNEYYLAIYHTAVSYTFYNILGLFALAFISILLPNSKKIKISAYFIFIGTLVFAASLYALVFLEKAILGAITPIGGALMIIGWFILCYAILKDLKLEPLK